MGIKTVETEKEVGDDAAQRLVELEGVEKLRNLLPSDISLGGDGGSELEIILHAIKYIESLQHDLTQQHHVMETTSS